VCRSVVCVTRPRSGPSAHLHRRAPGQVIQSMKKAGSGNPVFLLDEVDKMSTDFRGDPSSALLEVLDPEQNQSFNDHYLDVDYDLSKVMFVTTANTLDRIPRPAAGPHGDHPDRGYTELEKLNIAKRYLVPKQREAKDSSHRTSFSRTRRSRRSSITTRRRPAFRSLEREIAACVGKVAVEVVKKAQRPTSVSRRRTSATYLGPARYRLREGEAEHRIGVATGLAWTDLGGGAAGDPSTGDAWEGKLLITAASAR